MYRVGRRIPSEILDVDREQQHLGVMPKKKDPPLSAAEQRRRFEELARDVGARQSPEQFKRTLKSAVILRRKDKPKPK
jgi:hypothetical protein